MSDARKEIDCQGALDRLYEFLDSEIDRDTEAAIRSHLEECADCFKFFDFEKTYLRFLEAKTRAAGAPEGLRRRLLETLLREDPESDLS